MRTDAGYKLHGHHFRWSAEQHFDSGADVRTPPNGVRHAIIIAAAPISATYEALPSGERS